MHHSTKFNINRGKKAVGTALIRDYYASIHAEIGVAVVVDLDDDNVFVYVNEPREPMKVKNSAYYSFEKNMDVDEAFECTSGKNICIYAL